MVRYDPDSRDTNIDVRSLALNAGTRPKPKRRAPAKKKADETFLELQQELMQSIGEAGKAVEALVLLTTDDGTQQMLAVRQLDFELVGPARGASRNCATSSSGTLAPSPPRLTFLIRSRSMDRTTARKRRTRSSRQTSRAMGVRLTLDEYRGACRLARPWLATPIERFLDPSRATGVQCGIYLAVAPSPATQERQVYYVGKADRRPGGDVADPAWPNISATRRSDGSFAGRWSSAPQRRARRGGLPH